MAAKAGNAPAQPTADKLARIGYDAYGAVTDHKNYQGLPMPEYDDLTPTIKQAWEANALAIRDAVLGKPSSKS